MRPILVVPGWTSSGPEHWQSLWERANPAWRRVEQRDWETPDPAEWVATLDAAVAAAPAPPVLVAHSLGCIAVAHWVARSPSAPAAGALLVAPADVEREDAPAALRAFAPIPLRPLPFPALVVASRDDPYVTFARAGAMAAAWEAELVDAGYAGHLNTAAGFGPWPVGQALLHGLLAHVG
jgi:hypothetical protein